MNKILKCAQSRIRGDSLFMRKFDFLFGAMLNGCLQRHSDNLSKALQSPQVSALGSQKLRWQHLLLKPWKHYGMMRAFGLILGEGEFERKGTRTRLPRRR